MNEEKIINDKIRKMGTNIIGRTKEYLLLEDKLKEIYNCTYITFKEIYKGSRDGDGASSFHDKCDDLVGSLILIKSDDEIIFGGFTKQKWEGDCKFKFDNDCFLFSFYPLKIYQIKKDKKAIFCNKNFGPCFGGITLGINDHFLANGGWCCSSFLSNFDEYEKDYELGKGENEFKIEEMEIYQILISNDK